LEDIAALSTQAVNLQVTSQADRSAILATVAAADIQAQQQQTYNNLLLATVRAGEVPTPSERLALTAGGAMSAEMLNTTSGEFALQQIGTAGFVRPEDDCFQTHQQYFDRMTTNTIYMTGVAVNVVQGTALRVDWIYDNQIVYTSSWSAPSDAEVRCFAIPMNASEVVFNEGAWTARLFLNGVPFESKAFEIVG
jgi:hypothetical protein